MTDVMFREVECASALNRVKGMPFEWSLNAKHAAPKGMRDRGG